MNTGPLSPRQAAGERSSVTRKPASEFYEHRQYAPGDDVRYVDWKASARQEHIFIKQNTDPKGEMIYLLLDTSASMSWGTPPKSEAALALASLLGFLALAQQDRLLVLPVSNEPVPGLHRLWGKGQSILLNRYLQSLSFAGQADISTALANLKNRKVSQGGLVLVISDLLGVTDLSKALSALPAPTWRVVLCHMLHPQELDPGINGDFEMLDIETGQKKRYPVTAKILEQYRRSIQAWQDQLAQTCQERRAVYMTLPTHGSIVQEMIPELLRNRVVKRL